jgi:hypothetical protein
MDLRDKSCAYIQGHNLPAYADFTHRTGTRWNMSTTKDASVYAS